MTMLAIKERFIPNTTLPAYSSHQNSPLIESLAHSKLSAIELCEWDYLPIQWTHLSNEYYQLKWSNQCCQSFFDLV